MIPLNKPLIFKNNSSPQSRVPEVVLSELFPDYLINITFSARQSLNLIYKRLFTEFGSLRISVSPLTCFEALYPIVENGHKVSFIDIDPDTFNMEESSVTADADVVQAIHLGGNPQNMSMICSSVRERHQILIEDCAQAFLSYYEGSLLGSFGDYAVFSFPKNFYALAGGLLLSKKLLNITVGAKMGIIGTCYKYAKRLMESKLSYDQSILELLHILLINIKPESTSTLHKNLAINSHVYQTIADQLDKMYQIHELRQMNAHYLINKIQNKNIILQKTVLNAQQNYNRLYFKSINKYADSIIRSFRKVGIGANHLTQNTRKYYQLDVFTHSKFKPFAERAKLFNYCRLHDKIFCIPISPALSRKELDYMAHYLNQV